MASSSEGNEEVPPFPVIVLGQEVRSITDPRERLLFAGLHVIMRSRADLVIGGLQPDAVVAIAGRSRRNFYDHFESKEAFVVALFQRFLLDIEVLTGMTDGQADLPLIPDFRSNVRSWFSDPVLESIEVVGALAGAVMWSSTPDDSLGEILADHTRMADLYFTPRYEAFLETWDLSLVPGWTPLQLVTVVRGIADGFVMRFRPSCGDFTEEHLDLLVATVVGVFATAVLDPGEPVERAQSKEEAPQSSLADRMGGRLLSAGPTFRVVDARRALRKVFLEELQHRPTEEINLRFLAEKAGIATSTAVKVSGSVHELSRLVLDDFVTSFESLLDEADSDLVYDRATAHLQRVSTFGFQYAPLIRCWLTYAPDRRSLGRDPVDRLVHLLATLLNEAPSPFLRQGLASGALDAVEVARFITLPLLIPENEARSSSRSDFADEIAASGRMIQTMLDLYLDAPGVDGRV